jgi:hypothetical protein
VGEERQAAGGFDLVGDPIPVADGLQGHGSAFRKPFEERLDGARFMIDPGLVTQLASLIENGKVRIAFVGVTSDPIIRHGCTSFFTWLVSRHECSRRCSTFI